MNEVQLQKKRIVFLGTPAVVVPVLKQLNEPNPTYHVVAVVSQPPTRASRGHGIVPSPVHQYAEQESIPVLTPENAKSPEFIEALRSVEPDLCVTAAYGQVLSEEFLQIPKFGTLNIHPSMLPLFRGAAPVQRALESGVQETGVTVAQTVRAMDAGPVVAQVSYKVTEQIKAPELLAELFDIGAKELISLLPKYFSGQCSLREQDHTCATKANKISIEESVLMPAEQGARALHNKVRAFAGWPGCRLKVFHECVEIELKVIATSVSQHKKAPSNEIFFNGRFLELVCSDGTVLELLELQPPGKRAMAARDFWNGLKTKSMSWI
ncbi:MAG: hypothetical protein RJB13_65 [Pseudomonadota bacterium]|jgi:methionyl-tRNA formyltransferase